MKKFFAFFAIVFLAAGSLYGQATDQTELVSLQNKLRPLLLKDDYEDVIPIAVKILTLEKRLGNAPGYEHALRNLAKWRSKRQVSLAIQFRKPKQAQENFTLATENFRELVALAEVSGDPLKLASAQVEMADFLFSFASSTSEAEKFYTQALAIREKNLAPDSEDVLSIVNNLSGIYLNRADFENFFPLNRRFIFEVEKRYGVNDKRLGPALAAYTIFLAVTDREVEARDTASRVASITGKPFHPRSGDLTVLRSTSKIDLFFGRQFAGYQTGGGFSIPDPTNVQSNTSRTTAGALRVSDGAGPMAPVYTGGRAIKTSLLIDETGAVIKVVPLNTNEKIASKIIERLMQWKFRPLVIEGTPLKMRCDVLIQYSDS